MTEEEVRRIVREEIAAREKKVGAETAQAIQSFHDKMRILLRA